VRYGRLCACSVLAHGDAWLQNTSTVDARMCSACIGESADAPIQSGGAEIRKCSKCRIVYEMGCLMHPLPAKISS
jgi:hypothetical protein